MHALTNTNSRAHAHALLRHSTSLLRFYYSLAHSLASSTSAKLKTSATENEELRKNLQHLQHSNEQIEEELRASKIVITDNQRRITKLVNEEKKKMADIEELKVELDRNSKVLAERNSLRTRASALR